ncbi:MAG: HAD family hydrolase [Austwickia sp.]|jgi:putative hydrolase of the HAD superfamily|nr:MAG: HAD family hydrolase [Austwickia sp.]
MSVRAVLFDMDGTLLDHAAASAAAGEAFVARVRPDLPVAEAMELWSDADHDGYQRFLAGEMSFQERRRYGVRGLVPALVHAPDQQVDETFAGYLADYQARWRAYPDARPALAAVLDMGLRVAVVSNNSLEQTLQKADVIGLWPELTPIVASEEVGAAKPDPRIFLAACEAIDCPPADTVMVGDDLMADVLGALRAGLRATWLNRDDPRTVEESLNLSTSPAPTIHSLTELTRVLS